MERKPATWGAGSPATALLALLAGLLLFNSGRSIAQVTPSSASQANTASATLQNAPPTFVVGFVGGYVHADDLRHSEVQLARTLEQLCGERVKVEVFKNRKRAQAHKAILEWIHGLNSQIGASQPRIILFGHSWGASALVYLARELGRDEVSVALTVQVDSVRKHGEDDSIIPPNVAEAINFYQSRGIIHGRSTIVAADPARTKILGNLRFEYQKVPAECRAYPWHDRFFFKGHTSIECDPRVWSQVEHLIEARVTATPAHVEVAAQVGN